MLIRRPLICFNVDDPAAATPAPETPAAPELTGPWANDLKEYFGEDPELLTKANAFMAEKYQPYVTRLEQESAPARALYKDLTEDFDGTMQALLTEVYEDRPDIADRYQELIAAGATPAEATETIETETAEAVTQLPAEVQELVAERQEAKNQAAYNAALDELKASVNDPDFDDNEFAPFVITANGDLGKAYTGYSAWRDAVKAKYAPAAPAPETPDTPAPLGTTTGNTPAAPPTEKKYESLDAALDDAMADWRAARQAPTTVGTV
jgi:hypothetical protein